MGIVCWIDLIWKEKLPVEPAGTSACCSSLKECVFLMFVDLFTDAAYRPHPLPNWPKTSMGGQNGGNIWRKFGRAEQPQREPTWWSRCSRVPGGNFHPGEETCDPSPWHFSIPYCSLFCCPWKSFDLLLLFCDNGAATNISRIEKWEQ